MATKPIHVNVRQLSRGQLINALVAQDVTGVAIQANYEHMDLGDLREALYRELPGASNWGHSQVLLEAQEYQAQLEDVCLDGPEGSYFDS
jgi:hypothetical protein